MLRAEQYALYWLRAYEYPVLKDTSQKHNRKKALLDGLEMFIFETGAKFSAVIHLFFFQDYGDIIKVRGEAELDYF